MQNSTQQQVQEEKYKNLGKHQIQSSSGVNPIKNIDANLRTASAHKPIKVVDALSEFADQNFDLDKLVKSPESFSYNKRGPNAIQGFPDEKILDPGLNHWYTQAGANQSEEKVFNELSKTLKAPGLILNGLEVRDTLKVLKQNIKEDVSTIINKSKHLLGHEVTPDEWVLSDILNIDKTKIEQESDGIFMALCGNLPDPIMDFNDITSNYSNLPPTDQKKMKGIYSNLKEEFVKQSTVYNSHPFQEEVKHYITRKLYKKEVDRNQEFDFLCLEKLPKAVLHVEVKSYPQKGSINPKGLKKVFIEACEQIDKGKTFIENILAPSAELSTDWTRVSLVWFPEIPDKKPFEDLNIKKDYLKYILTGEDLSNDDWWTSLGLGTVGIDDGSYKRTFAFLLGSQYLSIDSQIYDWSKDRREVNERLVGATGVGVGGGERFPDGQIQGKDLKGLHLGHVFNIIFWTPDQKDLKDAKGHKILVGDFGGGKSSVLISWALSAAEDSNNKVVFISAVAVDAKSGKTTILHPIFDEAVHVKFEGTNVTSFSVHSLIHKYGLPPDATFIAVMEAFLNEFGGPDLVLLLDEASVSKSDLKNIARNRESDLSSICQKIANNSKMSCIALSSSALNEQDNNVNGIGECILAPFTKAYYSCLGVGSVDICHLETYFQTHTQHTLAPLTKTMRNTNNIVRSAKDIQSYYTSWLDKIYGQTRNIVPPGATHTVPGEKPELILCRDFTGSPPEAVIQFVLTDILKLSLRQQGIPTFPPPNERIVVLCDGWQNPRNITTIIKKLTGWGDDVAKCYDSGVRRRGYSRWVINSANPVPVDQQRQEVRSFLKAKSGILVTYGDLFNGMENTTVVCIKRYLGGAASGDGVRSGLLRACSKLVLITEGNDLNLEEVSSKFTVHDRRHLKQSCLVAEEPGNFRISTGWAIMAIGGFLLLSVIAIKKKS